MDSQLCALLQMPIYYMNFDPQIPMHHQLSFKFKKDAEISGVAFE